MWVDEVLPYPICWLGFGAMEILTFKKIEIIKDEIKSQLQVIGGKLHRAPESFVSFTSHHSSFLATYPCWPERVHHSSNIL